MRADNGRPHALTDRELRVRLAEAYEHIQVRVNEARLHEEQFATEVSTNLHRTYQAEASEVRMLMDSTLQERRHLEMAYAVLGHSLTGHEEAAYQLGFGRAAEYANVEHAVRMQALENSARERLTEVEQRAQHAVQTVGHLTSEQALQWERGVGEAA